MIDLLDGVFAVLALAASWGGLYWSRRRQVRRERRSFGPDASLAARYGGSRSWDGQ